MKKRILSLLCVLCLLLTMLPTSAFAAGYDAPKLSIDASYLAETNQVKMSVKIGAYTDLGALDFHVKYDKEKLKVNGTPTKGGLLTANSTVSDNNSWNPATIGVGWNDENGSTTTTTTEILTVIFDVIEGKAGAVDFSFDETRYNFCDKSGDNSTDVPGAGSVTSANVTIPKAPITSVTIADLDAPVKGAAPDTSVTVTPSSLAADVKWFDGATPVAGNFAANTAYTVKIKLTASGGDNFAETVTAGDYTVTRSSDTELLLTKTFGATADKDPLTGSFSITGTPKIGEELTADTSALPSDVTGLTYKWYRVGTTESLITGETGKTYTPSTKDDVGKKIKVVVSAENYSGSVEETTTDAVVKAAYTGAAPTEKPAVLNVTDTQVTANPSTVLNCYGVTLATETTPPSSWTMTGIISGLTPNTKYKLWGCITSDTVENSPATWVEFTTKKSPIGDDAKGTLAGYTGVYDGNPHNAITGAAQTGYTVQYSTTSATSGFSGAMPTVTSVADSKTVWVKLSKADHEDKVFEMTATVTAKSISGAVITYGTQKTYNGTEQDVVITSVELNGTALTGSDYAVDSTTSKATNVEEKTLKINGKGNYTGSATAATTWKLVAKDVTITPASGLSKTYGAADPTLTYTTDLTAGSALETAFNTAKSGTLSYTGTDVGSYDIEIGTLTAGNNFNLKMVTPAVKFTINQATPSITATSPRQLVKNDVEVDITGWASFDNTDSGAKLTYTLDGTPAGITLTGNMLKAANDASTVSTFNIKVNAAATTNFAAPSEKVIVVNVVTKSDAGVSITGAPTSKTYGDAEFTLTAAKTAPDGGTWSWNSSNPAILEIISGADTATPTIKVTKADTAGATLTVTYTSSTHYGSANATITVAPKTLTAADLTYSSPITKVYDGSDSAPTGLTVSVKPGSLVGTDTLAVTGTLKYNSANVNEADKITFTPTAITTGNYALAATEVLTITGAKITAKDVKLTGGINATDRSYVKDNKTVSLTKGTLTFDGLVGSETLDVNIPATGTISDAKVGAYNVTYSGVTLADGTGKASNYKLVSPLPAVTVNITKAATLTLADIPVSQKFTTTTGEKAIGAVMPTDAGALTYTKGAESKTGSVTIDSWAVDTTGKVTYTLSGGVAGDTVTLPVTIGSDNYENSTVNVVITLTAKDNQAALTLTGGTTVVYGQTLQLGTTGGNGTGTVTYAVTNGTGEATIDATGKLTPVKVGTVKVKATKAEDANYNAITSAEVEITITRATPTGAPKYTAITTGGKTLADAGLTTTGSTLNPNAGTLVWVDNAGNVLPGTTAVAANTTYKWLFTPADANYTTLTGSIELYHKSSSGGGGWYYTYYTIKATAGTNGSISPSGWTSVRDGRDQTFTITPDKGYAVAKVLVDGKSVGAVKSYTFKNVTKDHTIEAIFMKSNGNPQTGVFVDVAEGSYYEKAIDWAVEKGITNGVSSNMFAPNDPCTRAQIVTFLWRAAGSPAPKSMSSFTDVPADAFYAKAVAWAVENGITSGTGESKFSPNSTCTRAQAVTFLYRASGSPAVSGSAEFSDVATNAYYADAVAWAAKKGITTGIGGGLFGADNDCTRGQIVTFLWRAMTE